MYAARGLALAVVTLAGCSIHIGPPSSSGGGITGHSADTLDGHIDYQIAYQANDNGVYLVMVTDGASSGGAGGGRGQIATADGRQVEWSCQATDGRSGTVNISGTKYQLRDGGLFLVSVRGGKTFVRQVAADFSQVHGPVDLEAVKTAAKNDPHAVEFLAEIEKPRR